MDIALKDLDSSPSLLFSFTTTSSHYLTEWRNDSHIFKVALAEMGYALLVIIGIVETVAKGALAIIALIFAIPFAFCDQYPLSISLQILGEGCCSSLKGAVGTMICLKKNLFENAINFPILLFNTFHSSDYYSAFNLSPDATPQDIASAHRKLLAKAHPDKVAPTAENKCFRENINNVKEVLDEREKLGINGASSFIYCFIHPANADEIQNFAPDVADVD